MWHRDTAEIFAILYVLHHTMQRHGKRKERSDNYVKCIACSVFSIWFRFDWKEPEYLSLFIYMYMLWITQVADAVDEFQETDNVTKTNSFVVNEWKNFSFFPFYLWLCSSKCGPMVQWAYTNQPPPTLCKLYGYSI